MGLEVDDGVQCAAAADPGVDRLAGGLLVCVVGLPAFEWGDGAAKYPDAGGVCRVGELLTAYPITYLCMRGAAPTR